jgi:Mrp family chromosome partitioning ATPase
LTEEQATGQQEVAGTPDSSSSGSAEQEQAQRFKASMGRIKHKLIVLSGKGGVGKSTVTADLAMALARSDLEIMSRGQWRTPLQNRAVQVTMLYRASAYLGSEMEHAQCEAYGQIG